MKKTLNKKVALTLVGLVVIAAGIFLYKMMNDMRPKEIFLDKPKVIVGISIMSSYKLPIDQQSEAIGNAWDEFKKNDVINTIPNAIDTAHPYGVYHNYGSNGEYTLTIGAEVDSINPKDEKFTYVTIPAGKYLSFEKRGMLPKVAIDTWIAAANFFNGSSKYQRTYDVDYEQYINDEFIVHMGYQNK